jgi:hypothetical protein
MIANSKLFNAPFEIPDPQFKGFLARQSVGVKGHTRVKGQESN